MKRMILTLTTLALAGASVQTASAGGCYSSCGWSTAGKVLAGVTAGLVVGSALVSRPAYYVAPDPVIYPAPGYGYTYAPAQPAVVYTAPARVVYPAPAVVYAAPAPVLVCRPPVCVAPPAVSVSFGFYSGCGPRYYRRGCW